MDEEFESLVVTDPKLVDPSIDVSGLRTQTDTSLLGNIPDYAGIQYEAFNPNRLSDLMRLYSSGLPAIDTPEAAVPPATGGGGSGDGGQATTPTDDFNKQEFEKNLVDQGVGLQIEPGQPVVAPGEMPVTNLEMAIYNDPNLGVVDVDGEGEFGGLINGTDPDRIQANEFAGIETPTGIGPTYDEAGLNLGIPDRGRGQISTSADEFDVTTDQFTRPTMADVAGPSDFTGAPITIQQTVMDGQPIDPEYDIEAIPITTGAPPNIVMAKDPEGVVDPFDGKYTMSTAITPEDTEQSITQKIADFLGVDASKINKAAVTGALNLVAGKALDTAIPIFTVADLIKDPFVKSPEQEAAEEQARQDNIDEAAAITQRLEDEITPQDIIDDRGRGEIPTRTEPEPTPTFEPPRGGGADRDPDPAPSAPSFDPGQGFVDQGGEGEFGGAPSAPSKPSFGTGSGGLGDYQIQPSKPTTGTTKPGTGGGTDSGGSPGGSSKIVCTMMNESYGFGSFRNKIWLRHSKGLAPEYQKGYHKIFLPLVKLSKKNIVLKKILEHIAVHRTIDIRQESRGKVHLLGRVYRKILEPVCYWVGKHG